MLLNCGVGEDSWESHGLPGDPPVHPKGNQFWIFIGSTDPEAETPLLWPPDEKNWLTGKDPDAGKDWRQEKGMTKDKMVGWSHRIVGHEFEQAPGVGNGQGSLVCCRPWGHSVRHDWVTKLWKGCSKFCNLAKIPAGREIFFPGPFYNVVFLLTLKKMLFRWLQIKLTVLLQLFLQSEKILNEYNTSLFLDIMIKLVVLILTTITLWQMWRHFLLMRTMITQHLGINRGD